MNTARTTPSAMPMRHAHMPIFQENLPKWISKGCTMGSIFDDHVFSFTNRIQPEIAGSSAQITHAPTGGKASTAGKRAAAMRKASGASNEVRRGSTLRYSSPYPRSINPDPAPVKIEPSAHSSIDGASGSVAQASASVPTVVRAGPRNRKARRLISVAKRRWKIALANKVAHSTSVDPRYAPAGSGSPFQVMELVAVPRNMRYTQARAKAKPTMRRFRRLRGDVSRNRS